MSTSSHSPSAERLWPGLALTMTVAAGATLLVALLARLPGPLGQLPLSAMLVSVLVGLSLAPLAARRADWVPGLDLARGRLLKIAVALIGLRLSLSDLGRLGLEALPLVLATVILGLGLTWALTRLAGAHWRLSALLAVGTAICGASAIAATAPGLNARREEVCFAVACIALIGLAASLIYPPLLQLWLVDPQAIGLVMGAAIHDTAQVTAAATLHEQVWSASGTLDAATVTKLLRNSLMLLLIPALVWVANRNEPGQGRVPLPLFILGFIALCGLRSLGDLMFGSDAPLWRGLIELATAISVFVFAMAMAALAASIRFSDLRLIGWKPAAAAVLSASLIFALAVAIVLH